MARRLIVQRPTAGGLAKKEVAAILEEHLKVALANECAARDARIGHLESEIKAYANRCDAYRDARKRDNANYDAERRELASTLRTSRIAVQELRRDLESANHKLEKRGPDEAEHIRNEVRRAVQMLAETEFVQEVADMRLMITEWYNTLVTMTDFPDVGASKVVDKPPTEDVLTDDEARWGKAKW